MISKKCIKCGSEDATIEFKGEKARVEETDSMAGTRCLFIEPKRSNDELLLVTCNCCGYVWLEKPLDSE